MSDRANEATVTVSVSRPRRQAWRALVYEIAQWWPKRMRNLGPGSLPILEPEPGGRLYEHRSDGSGILLATVGEVLTEESLVLMPTGSDIAGSLAAIRMEDSATGGCSITISLSGSRPEVVEWWEELFKDGLKAYLDEPRPV